MLQQTFAFLLVVVTSACCCVVSAQSVVDKPVATSTSVASPKEDWGALTADRKSLSPLSAAVMGHNDTADYSLDIVRLHWRPADDIDLYVCRPLKVEHPRVIVYLYGYPADTDRYREPRWCSRMTKGGFAAAGFVPALSGQRYGGRPMKQWFVSELRESIGKTTHDIQMVLDYLASRGDMDVTHAGILGQGSGGTAALLAASVDDRLAAVDALDPWGDWPEWLATSKQVPDDERPRYVTPEFLAGVASLDPLQVLPGLKRPYLRIEQQLDEPTTPVKVKETIAAAAPSTAEVVTYKDQGEHFQAYLKSGGINGWLVKTLSEPAKAAK